jgi:hypothetical protein
VVRLTFDGQRLEAPLTLKPDPRVTAGPEALAQQLQVATRLAGLLTQSSQALLTARSENAQLKALAPAGTALEAVRAYQARLAELLGSDEAKPPTGAAPSPAAPQAAPAEARAHLKDAQEQISGLYSEVTRADAAPTAAQRAATDSLQDKLTGVLTTWQQLQADLPELNKRLQAAKLAPIRTDLAPPRDADLADEE